MSGSSRVDFTSESYRVVIDSPVMNFSVRANPPGTEQKWHREWQANATIWLERLKPILEQRFSLRPDSSDPDWPLVPYDERFPLWSSSGDPKAPPPWRYSFGSMKGPRGTTEVIVAVSRPLTAEARDRFKRELEKDFAMIEPLGKGLP
jgi:hypothetical protein